MVNTPSQYDASSSSLAAEDSEPPIGNYSHRQPKSQLQTLAYTFAIFLFLSLGISPADALPNPTTASVQLVTRTAIFAAEAVASTCACKEEARKHDALFAVEAAMIPVLVILSGILAGLTLGYMSLDTTQLQVLAKTGTAKQRYYASRVIPIRKNGHLLLITLLLGNMIVNETLPVIADGVLGGGVQAVVISTVLVVIFAEIIPQSVCSRFGLAIGSAMVWPVQILIYIFWIVAWPVAQLLEYLLGSHSGIVYRRAELKELIAMHGAGEGGHGDLDRDTITIVGATLDLQTKTVNDAMTPMTKVFQLNINTKLDYETLGQVLKAGHSRIPVFEEVGEGEKKRNKIIGVLLTKQLILLDPEDAVPLRDIPMNALPTVPADLPLLQILNTFQEGRSHMAIVRQRPGAFNPKGTDRVASDLSDREKANAADSDMEKGEATGEQSLLRSLFHHKRRKSDESEVEVQEPNTSMASVPSKTSLSYTIFDDEVPIGVITLEDVLEELIGEEIYDETDQVGSAQPALKAFIPPEAVGRMGGGPPPAPSASVPKATPAKSSGGLGLGRLGIKVGRSRSAPGKARNSGESAAGGPPAAPSAVAPPVLQQEPGKLVGSPAPSPAMLGNEPDPLSLIVEQTSDSSDTEGESKPAPSFGGSTATTLGGVQPPSRRASTGASEGAVVAGPRAPAALADAVLLERGRRLLVAQGADPAALPNLRLAAPRSLPPSRSSTPTPGAGGNRLVVPPPPAGAQTRKGAFKSPALLGALPVRHQSTLGNSASTTPAPATPTPATPSEEREGNGNSTNSERDGEMKKSKTS